jgi:hypothetical protein
MDPEQAEVGGPGPRRSEPGWVQAPASAGGGVRPFDPPFVGTASMPVFPANSCAICRQ